MASSRIWRFSPEGMRLDERFGFGREFAAHARERLGIAPGMRVLEAGCGTGGFTRFLADGLDATSEIVGTDRDTDLLSEADDATAAAGARVRFAAADALRLPFRDRAFDAVVSQFLLCVMPRPLDALREMRRVTRPGGIVASVSCFCKSGIFPTFLGLHEFEGATRLTELRTRFAEVYRTRIRNPGLGLPNGNDLDVWGDYHLAGLRDLRITGYLTVFAPSDSRWTDEEALAYVEQRRRIETGLVGGLTEAQLDVMDANGVSRADVAELAAILDAKYEWLLADVARVRRGMEVFTDPAVLITGRVPA